ncbi:hypothetical protein BDN71DRAFT_1439943 [Pleurotus eryngii]|uniref:Prokaryotic-type class I peptide chain release factors domain-containing protein n=1 Tax=Pleurotus eryngii TaxID=5323 RepID=A0A9P6A6T5_PLEER|nr:hypothetical protein BDN71DRAFT_1439943 [Pleurotus eryngii]
MSITPSLRAAARSAYRDLWRAARTTFSGDEPVFQAFREKMRADALRLNEVASPEAYSSGIATTKEIASVLRKNVVQASLAYEPDPEGKSLWKLRMTRDTELGSNDSIKNLGPIPSSRSSRRQKCCSEDADKPPVNDIRFYSALKRAHRDRVVPDLREEDLEESFVRGSGPGGQAINKTMSNVQLLHKPTGIRVNCQETRSLELNRRFARRILVEKLDRIQNPGLSKGELQKAKQRERERRRRKKAKKKAQEKEKLAEP